jgi:hypothetical protein
MKIDYQLTETNGLWLPRDPLDLITFLPGDEPDESNVHDCDVINRAGMDWLDYDISDEEYFDILSQKNIDPKALLQGIYDHFHQLTLKI